MTKTNQQQGEGVKILAKKGAVDGLYNVFIDGKMYWYGTKRQIIAISTKYNQVVVWQ